MGRKANFTDEQVFGWLANHLADAPAVSVQQLSKGAGLSIGSIYHRFGSMENVLAEAWLWAYRRFSAQVIEQLAADGLAGAVKTAMRVLRFANADREAGVLLFCVPERFLLRPTVDAALLEQVAEEKAKVHAAIHDYARRFESDPETVELSVLMVPMALAQKFLPHQEIPPQAEVYVRKACRMIIAAPLT